MAKDFVKLLGADGEARKYFKDATGGAAWVDSFCDQISEQLQEKYVYFAVDKDFELLMLEIVANYDCKGFSCWRLNDGRWQANFARGSQTNFYCVTKDDIIEAFLTAKAGVE